MLKDRQQINTMTEKVVDSQIILTKLNVFQNDPVFLLLHLTKAKY
jgi:hypothetical protein